MVGLGKSRMRRQRSKYMVFSWRNLPSGVSRMSRHLSGSTSPTQRLEVVAGGEVGGPLAAITTTRTSSSASARSKAASSSSMSWVSWALATSGRFKVMVATASSTLVFDGVEGGAHRCSYRGSRGRPMGALGDGCFAGFRWFRRRSSQLDSTARSACQRPSPGVVGVAPPQGGRRRPARPWPFGAGAGSSRSRRAWRLADSGPWSRPWASRESTRQF